MILAVIVLNVLLAALVLGGMLALHGWAILSDAGRRPRAARLQRAPRVQPAQWRGARGGGLATR